MGDINMKPNLAGPFIVLPYNSLKLKLERLHFIRGVIFDRTIRAHGFVERFWHRNGTIEVMHADDG